MTKTLLNKYKSCLFAIFCFIACLILCACSQFSNNGKTNITDIRGTHFDINTPINKVVSAHNPTLNHLIVLGEGSSKYINGFGRKDMSAQLYSKILPDWNDLEIIGNDSSPVNKETILSLNPDLIILPEYNWAVKEKDYEGINIPIFVCFPNNESFDSVMSSLDMLAKLFGQENLAQTIAQKYYEIINEAKSSVDSCSDKPKIAFLGPRIYTIASTNMIQNQIIETAGGQNCTSGYSLNDHFSNVEPEILVSMDPDYILIPSYAEYSTDDILHNDKLSNIKAVKNGQVYKFPSNLEPWDMPTCASALGVAWLANKLHPDMYSKEILSKNTLDFYELLYKHKFSESDFILD